MICTPHVTHIVCMAHRAASWGICLYCTYRSWFQTTEVEAPLDTGGSLKFLRRLHLNPPAPVNLQPAGSAQSQVGVKAKHLIAWQIICYVRKVFMCNYWRRYDKSSRPVFLRPHNKWLPLHLFYTSPSDDMIGNTCHEFACHRFPYFC